MYRKLDNPYDLRPNYALVAAPLGCGQHPGRPHIDGNQGAWDPLEALVEVWLNSCGPSTGGHTARWRPPAACTLGSHSTISPTVAQTPLPSPADALTYATAWLPRALVRACPASHHAVGLHG